MVRVELSQSKIRRRRRRRRTRLAVVIAIGLLLILVSVVAFFNAPFLKVTDVAVVGTQTLNAGDIKAYVQQRIAGDYLFVFPKDDILLYPQSSLQQGLLGLYPAAKSISVHADNFHTIGVVVQERQPAALWCAVSGECYLMDADGVVYAPSAATSSDLYATYSGAATGSAPPEQYLSVDTFQSLTALVAALSQIQAGNRVTQVAVDANGDARAYFQDGFYLIFNSTDASGDVYQRLTLALKSDPLAGKTLDNLAYIDLRFGDKVYYLLKGSGH